MRCCICRRCGKALWSETYEIVSPSTVRIHYGLTEGGPVAYEVELPPRASALKAVVCDRCGSRELAFFSPVEGHEKEVFGALAKATMDTAPLVLSALIEAGLAEGQHPCTKMAPAIQRERSVGEAAEEQLRKVMAFLVLGGEEASRVPFVPPSGEISFIETSGFTALLFTAADIRPVGGILLKALYGSGFRPAALFKKVAVELPPEWPAVIGSGGVFKFGPLAASDSLKEVGGVVFVSGGKVLAKAWWGFYLAGPAGGLAFLSSREEAEKAASTVAERLARSADVRKLWFLKVDALETLK